MITPDETCMSRCEWCGSDPLYIQYHDEEWGIPVHNDRHLFEMLTLEGAQAGLSWLTILRKRENYRRAFDNFNIDKVAGYTDEDVARLLADPGIVRNRLKIASAIRNARAVKRIIEESGSLDKFLWRFVDYSPRINSWVSISEIPVRTEESDAMSNELKKRGLNFVGSTICYSFMQAVGMVCDHVTGCMSYRKINS